MPRPRLATRFATETADPRVSVRLCEDCEMWLGDRLVCMHVYMNVPCRRVDPSIHMAARTHETRTGQVDIEEEGPHVGAVDVGQDARHKGAGDDDGCAWLMGMGWVGPSVGWS